jgi:hypothetical protein
MSTFRNPSKISHTSTSDPKLIRSSQLRTVESADDPLARRLTTDLTTENIHNAVALFFFDPTSAQGTYGPIASWHTAGVTSFNHLFCGQADSYCDTANTLGA